jgi:PAS domain S-box-containing protein
MAETVRPKLWPTRIAAGSAVFMVFLGLSVLAGWFSHTYALVQLKPHLPPMTRNAAACFLLCGVALLTVVRWGPRWLIVACAGIVSVISILTIVEYIFRVNIGIDELLGPSYIALRVSSPGRMAPVVAFCFALGSMGLLLTPRILLKRAGLLLGLTGSIIAAAGIATSMSAALGSSDAFGWGNRTRVALHTAVGLWVFGIGILALAWHVDTEQVDTPRWLPISVALGVTTSTVGLWQALIGDRYAPFALLPAVVLGGGCLMAAISGLTVYLAQHAHSKAAALRRSEARKAAILDSALDCIVTIDHEGRITEFNPAAERTFGHRREDVVGKQLADIIIPASLREQHQRGLGGSLITGEARVLGRRVEMTAVRSDGSEFPVELAITRITLDGPPSFTGYLRDITARKRALEKLHANQELLDLAQKSARAMAFDWYVQQDVNVWSPEQEALHGLQPGSFDGTYRSWKKTIYPPDWPVVLNAIKHAQETGDVTAEWRVKWPDGSLHWLSTNGQMFFDDQGKPFRMVGFTADVTRRKLAEEDLRRSEAFLAEAQRLTSIGSFSWRVGTDDITWSDQVYHIFDLDPAVPITLELIRTLIHPEDIPLFDEVIDRARANGNDFEYEQRLLIPEHSIKYLHVIAHGTRDQDGELEYIGAIQDVTERRLSEEALGKLRSELAHVTRVATVGALTASIAHEVNQPLSGIITNASTCLRMLAADPPNVDGARETAQRTIRDGHRASDVITQLRALFTRKDVTIESVDLNEAAREVIALSLSELQRNRVILRSELADDLPLVAGDRVQLQQVILNLLRNASDAMSGIEDRPRQLLIRTERDDSEGARLTVQDAGVGFEPQAAARLFEAFYTTKNDGMGIGLSVSRSIIESHHGRLWATPNDGPGATFSFSIPRGDDPILKHNRHPPLD